MMKIMMMAIVMLGILSGCSNSAKAPVNSEWPDSTKGGGHYFDVKIDNNALPYLYPYPLGSSNTYITMPGNTKISTDNYCAFDYPYGNSASHLNC